MREEGPHQRHESRERDEREQSLEGPCSEACYQRRSNRRMREQGVRSGERRPPEDHLHHRIHAGPPSVAASSGRRLTQRMTATASKQPTSRIPVPCWHERTSLRWVDTVRGGDLCPPRLPAAAVR